jgi:hypothetical protein
MNRPGHGHQFKRKSPQSGGFFCGGRKEGNPPLGWVGWGQPKKGSNMDKLTTLYKQNKPYFVILARTTRK